MASRNQVNPPPLRTISDFKSKLTGGGARANLFEVVLTFPDAAQPAQDVLDKSRFLVKGARLPASNIAQIEVPFRGRVLKIAGDRTFDSWTVTVINDTDFSIRSAFENWMNTINKLNDNTGLVNPADYQSDAFVFQLDRDGQSIRNIVSMIHSQHRSVLSNFHMTLKVFRNSLLNFRFSISKF